MKTTLKEKQIPYAITEYIKNNFGTDCVMEINKASAGKGRSYFHVELSNDADFYQLVFDENGSLVSENSKKKFPSDSPYDTYAADE